MFLFWLIAGILTLGTTVILAAPLYATWQQKSDDAYALDVYRDQLSEVARDEKRGVLKAEQAKAARLEIERRILALGNDRSSDDQAVAGQGASVARPASRGLVLVLAVLLPLGGVALYALLGQPQLPDEPAAERATAAAAVSPEILALQQKVAAEPSNVQAWLDLGRRYLNGRQGQEAADAFAHVVALRTDAAGDHNDARTYADYGRALVLFHDGDITDDTKAAFQTALELNSMEPTARFFLALAKAQRGNLTDALNDWVALEKDSPAGAPYRHSLTDAIDEATRQLGKNPARAAGRRVGP